MENIDLVLSYYNEPIQDIIWILNDIPENFNVYFYRKLDSKPKLDVNFPEISYFLNTLRSKNPRCKILEIPNVGRESDTYLHHIIQNYNNLADLTIFAQVAPHIHSPDFSNLLKNYKDYKDFQCLSDRYDTQWASPSEKYLEEKHVKDKYLNGYKSAATLYNTNCIETINYLDTGSIELFVNSLKAFGLINHDVRNKHQLGKALVNYGKLNIIELFLNKCEIIPKFNNGKVPGLYYCCLSACFGVKKNRILQNSIESYKKMKDLNHDHWVFGYLSERVWPMIFGPIYDRKTILDDLDINNLE